MKQQIISEVVQQMLRHLDNAQMQQLQKALENALNASYKNVEKIHFKDMHFRKDIGKKALNKIN